MLLVKFLNTYLNNLLTYGIATDVMILNRIEVTCLLHNCKFSYSASEYIFASGMHLPGLFRKKEVSEIIMRCVS